MKFGEENTNSQNIEEPNNDNDDNTNEPVNNDDKDEVGSMKFNLKKKTKKMK